MSESEKEQVEEPGTEGSQKEKRQAVGIKYEQGETPKIVAKGFGDLADEIVALAKENGVLVHEDEHLSDFLARLDLGQEIPPELYYVIAELIAFSYVLQGKFPDSWKTLHNKVSEQA
ncbi:EscU/YscU/HrcU family type III secretion system export apparatus switch protein [Paraneptunicella aestuarii]|uniref:EscU/YscU/HrcU family type III secretion system export apparatus switch protein n=1 Tax=Paraneptunicella aestuarii TaxID=2831148 RepID=UPI001E3CE92A|nr:EscU/YscU/HrcU family type III secretion system export apparatus switch protein [Paraneptunicella aestuarii]UAA38139.1 EscU/YscU/HrcU family type III secretion system export apparatus switch protein [Paraneptunicella aestuarii]